MAGFPIFFSAQHIDSQNMANRQNHESQTFSRKNATVSQEAQISPLPISSLLLDGAVHLRFGSSERRETSMREGINFSPYKL